MHKYEMKQKIMRYHLLVLGSGALQFRQHIRPERGPWPNQNKIIHATIGLWLPIFQNELENRSKAFSFVLFRCCCSCFVFIFLLICDGQNIVCMFALFLLLLFAPSSHFKIYLAWFGILFLYERRRRKKNNSQKHS